MALPSINAKIEKFIADKLPPTYKEESRKELVDLKGKGLNVGDIAPDFTLPNHKGKNVNLKKLLKKGPVLLAFYRGSWCPMCNIQLRGYSEHVAPLLKKKGGSVVAISPNKPEVSDSFVTDENLDGLVVLSDSSFSAIKDYNLLWNLSDNMNAALEGFGVNLEEQNGNPAQTLPIPGAFLIAQDGTIAAGHVNPEYWIRWEPSDIVDAVKSL